MSISSRNFRISETPDPGFTLRQRLARVAVFAGVAALSGCASLPSTDHRKYAPPNHIFVGDVKRPYQKIGAVRTKVNFVTLDPASDEDKLCANYYNKAAADLVKRAKEKGADAVIHVQSVVFLEDGRQQVFTTPECSDDGEEGQILLQGIAVKWKGADLEQVK